MSREMKMNGARYQLGDIVKLKSGSPNMTISDFTVMNVDANGKRIKDGSGVQAFAGKYTCTWSDNGKHQDKFWEEDLELSVDL